MNKEEILCKVKEVYGDMYDYSLIEDAKRNENIDIICKKHGKFSKRLSRFLNGSGCPKCSGKVRKTFDEFKEEASIIHKGFYRYYDDNYINSHTKIGITCPIHGVFYQTPTNHLNGNGCPKCKAEKLSEQFSSCTDKFIDLSIKIHNGNYSYENAHYVNNSTPLLITCKKHGDFWQIPHNHLQGKGCPVCGNNLSISENEIAEFLKENGVNIIKKDKKILNGKEIDILLPEYNIGIEYDGLYWHSDEFKDKNYHINKTNECSEKGIRLIHIFEDEWVQKKDIVKSRLLNVLNKTKNRIFARLCKIMEVKSTEAKEFLDNNHIQGNVYGKFNIGLYFNDELVSLMTFGSKRKNLGSTTKDGEYELLRFCNKLNTTVIGGASKLFKYFIEKYNPEKITSYCDLRWSNGNLYEQLNFKLSHVSKPNYFYIQGNNRKNRFKYRKSELIKEGYDENKSETEIMKERGIHKIYDCGCKVYEYKG